MGRRSEGFSLVEVIIAIAVLAISVMSLLAYFSSANRYVNWGKSTQKADMAAQSVIEELASCRTFDQIQHDLVASGSAVSGEKWEEIASPDPGDHTYKLSRKISVDGSDYTARVTLDFDSYKTSAFAGATTTPVSKFNDYEVPQLDKVYSDNNVVLEETDQTEAAVGDLFYQVYKQDKSITRTTIRGGLQRTMHIDIAPYTGGTDEEKEKIYVVKGRYEYRYSTYQCDMPVREVKIEKDSLKNIYLFYRPVNGVLARETLDVAADPGLPAGFMLTDFSFYAVLQKDTVEPPGTYELEITSNGSPASVGLKNKVYNNANKIGSGSDGLIEHKPGDRIAMVTVEIYDADETDFKEENRIVMMQTSKGA